MSLLKASILLPSVWLFNVAFTPPTPPPDSSECVTGGPLYERICPAVYPIMQRLTASIPLVAELAVILAANYPSRISSQLLSKMVPSGRLPNFTPDSFFVVGSIITLAGCFGRMWCFRALGQQFTHKLTLRKNHRLITTGPYSILRHPSYFFGILATVGVSLMIASPGSFARRCGWLETVIGGVTVGALGMQNVLSCVLSYARTKSEDALLRQRFGEEWDLYSQKVRYRLIPGLF